MSRLLQQGFLLDSNNTRKCYSNWELYNWAQSGLWIGNHCTNPFTQSWAWGPWFVIWIVLMCDASYVVRRTSRQTHDISYLTYVRSYDKVAWSTIEAMRINSDLLNETLDERQPYPAWATFGTVDMVVKPRVSAFQNCASRYMRHNIVQDIALATKLVMLWTGISVYTPIPVNRGGNKRQTADKGQ